MSESNLEDRAAIHDLFTRYCCALDNGEIETVVDCFPAKPTHDRNFGLALLRSRSGILG